MKNYRWRGFGLAVVLVTGLRASTAAAYITPVIDVAKNTIIGQQLVEAGKVYHQVNLMLAQLRRASKRLRGGEMMQRPLIGVQRLTQDVASIGFHLQTVSEQYREVFPDEQAMRDTSPQDAKLMGEAWERELLQSSQVAMRAQATSDHIEASARTAISILTAAQQSGSEEGSQVAAMQAFVKALGLVKSDMGLLAQAIAANARQDATVMAVEEARKMGEGAERKNAFRGWGTGWNKSKGLNKAVLEGGY